MYEEETESIDNTQRSERLSRHPPSIGHVRQRIYNELDATVDASRVTRYFSSSPQLAHESTSQVDTNILSIQLPSTAEHEKVPEKEQEVGRLRTWLI